MPSSAFLLTSSGISSIHSPWASEQAAVRAGLGSKNSDGAEHSRELEWAVEKAETHSSLNSM